ncbi:MAG TPA: LCP family protein [Actinomycetota bacterium]|nr:LCP family protein [Actinomycetota bacterium]
MSGGRAGGRRGRWAWGAVPLLLLVAATVVGPALLGSRSAGRPRALPLLAVGTTHRDSYLPVLDRRRPLFVLVLGSDARPGEPVARLRADSIHLIGVDVRHRRATVLGFPRDAWVEVPGYGRTKINNGMVLGGPELMVRTVERLTGIRIDFWVLTSFQGLVRMVDAVGPLEVEVDRPMFDRFSGTNFSPGRHRLSGREALAFARDRHSPQGGDLGRSLNQGKLMIAALRKLRADFRRHPALLFSWLAAGWRNVQTDLPPATLLELALTAASIPPARVSNLVVPATVGTAGAASVVFLSPGAASIYRDLRADGVVG